LREAIGRIVEAIVESVNENHSPFSAAFFAGAGYGRRERPLVEIVSRYGHEISLRITRRGSGPLDVANLPAVVGRYRNNNLRVGNCVGTLTGEHLPRIV
jgi:hypothetical protein